MEELISGGNKEEIKITKKGKVKKRVSSFHHSSKNSMLRRLLNFTSKQSLIKKEDSEEVKSKTEGAFEVKHDSEVKEEQDSGDAEEKLDFITSKEGKKIKLEDD